MLRKILKIFVVIVFLQCIVLVIAMVYLTTSTDDMVYFTTRADDDSNKEKIKVDFSMTEVLHNNEINKSITNSYSNTKFDIKQNNYIHLSSISTPWRMVHVETIKTTVKLRQKQQTTIKLRQEQQTTIKLRQEQQTTIKLRQEQQTTVKQRQKQQTTIKLRQEKQIRKRDFPDIGLANSILVRDWQKIFNSFAEYEKEKNLTRINLNSRKPKIFVELPGLGLGNRMFAYASGYAIAKENKREFAYIYKDKSLNKMFYIEQFPVPKSTHNAVYSNVRISHARCCIFNRAFLDLPPVDILLTGFFQSWKYFDKYRNEILKQFTFKSANKNKNISSVRGFIHKVKNTYGQTNKIIGIHIRRGDMLGKVLVKHGHKVADKEYLERAIVHYKGNISNCIFIVCSDDIPWAKENLSGHTHLIFSEGHSDMFDLELLTLCDHLIITVGSFGWWAGYLSNGMVVYYKDWPRKNSGFSKSLKHEDYFPNTWIGL